MNPLLFAFYYERIGTSGRLLAAALLAFMVWKFEEVQIARQKTFMIPRCFRYFGLHRRDEGMTVGAKHLPEAVNLISRLSLRMLRPYITQRPKRFRPRFDDGRMGFVP